MSNILKGLQESFSRDEANQQQAMDARRSSDLSAERNAGLNEPDEFQSAPAQTGNGIYEYNVPTGQEKIAQELGLQLHRGHWVTRIPSQRANFQFGRPQFHKLPSTGVAEGTGLSPATLASYKKKAGEEASALDKDAWEKGGPDAQKKIAKANKRFSGIVKATNKEFDNDIKGIKETASVTDYNPKSQGGTRKELLAKYHKTKNHKDAEAARKAGATQKELQGVTEGSESKIDSLKKKIIAKRDAIGLARERRRMKGQNQQSQREIKLQSDIDDLSNQITQLQDVGQGIAEGRVKDYAIQKGERDEMSPQQFKGQYGKTKGEWDREHSGMFSKIVKANKPQQKTGRQLDHCPTCNRQDNRCICEDASGLNVGDPVIITGNVQFNGKTGDVSEFSRDKSFVIVDLYNHGKHSFHSSDVSYNDYADSDDEQNIEEDLPPPENARKTQIAGTLPTYKKAADILNKTGVQGKALDFGAGLGMGTGELGKDAHSYEPYPGEKFKPHFVDVTKIPDNSYHKIVNLNVLNVVPNTGEHKIRDSIVKNIGRVLAPGGVALITTRGKDVLTIKGTPGEEPTSMISKIGTYQKGFTQRELLQYIQQTLGEGFEVSSIRLGPAGVMIKKLDQQGVAEGSDDKTQEILKAIKFYQQDLRNIHRGGGSVRDADKLRDKIEHLKSLLPQGTNGPGLYGREGVAEDTYDNKFDSMMSKVTSKGSLNAREALGLMDELIYQGGASYDEALQQASTSFEIDPAKLHSLYQQQSSTLEEDEAKPVNMKRWLRDYERREDNNFHTENMLAVAKLVGTPEDVAIMKKLVKMHNGFGLSEKQFEIRHDMYRRLWPLVKEKIAASQTQGLAEEDPCWKGYEQYGMKDKGGKKVPNCVPVKESKSNILKGIMR